MRSNLWPAETISGGCAVRYFGLRSGHKQDSSEGYEKRDFGTHAGIVVAIAPGGQRTIQLRFAKVQLGDLKLPKMTLLRKGGTGR
jgi:hypothetical protein